METPDEPTPSAPETPAPAPAASAPAPAAAAPAPLVDAQGNFTAKHWSEDPALCEKFTSLPALAKSYRHLESLIGKKGLVPPDEHAAPEQVDAFYNRLGRPEKADAYAYEKPQDWPEDAPWDDGRLDAFKGAAHKAGLSQKQFGALVDWANGYERGQLAQWNAQTERSQHEAMEVLRADPEIGGAELGKSMARARAVAERFGGEDVVNDPRLGDHPAVIRLLARVGLAMSEDSFAANDIAHAGGDSRGRIDAILADKSDPYWNARDPRHEARVQEVSRLFARAHPQG